MSKEPTPTPEGMTRENRPKASVAPEWDSLAGYPLIRNVKLQKAIDYAKSYIDTNQECFVAQWVLQNQDKNIDDYTLCYCHNGGVIEFWMERK